jgi:hypothetical protein
MYLHEDGHEGIYYVNNILPYMYEHVGFATVSISLLNNAQIHSTEWLDIVNNELERQWDEMVMI